MTTAIVQVAQRLGVELLPDNDQWEFRMEIRSSSSSRLYVVSRNKRTRQWGCSCPSWRTRRHCKHLAAMSSELRLLDAG